MNTFRAWLSSFELYQVAGAHLAEYRSKPLLNLGFIVSLAIATATLLSMLVLNHASKMQYQQANSQLKPPVAFTLIDKNGDKIKITDFARLRQLGFHQLKAVHSFKHKLANGKTMKIRAIDLLPLVLMDGDSFSSRKLNISRAYAGSLGLEAADSIEADSGVELELNFNHIENWGSTALIDIALAGDLFPEFSGLTHITSTSIPDAEKSRLERVLPEYLTIRDTWSIEEREGFADALHLNLSALAILGFIVSLFIAYQAANQAWSKRASLALQLRLLGVNLATIKKVMVVEGLVLTLLASGLGILLAKGLVSLLLPLLGLTLEQIYNLKTSGHFNWNWQYTSWAIGISAMAVLVALASQFNQIGTARVAFTSRSKMPQFNYRTTILVGSLLLAVFIFWPTANWHHLMFKYGLLLLGSVAFLPALMRYLLQAMAHFSRSFFLNYIFQDASDQVGRRYLPIAAFYLALTSSISAALMVSSFESSFVAYLNQLLRSDIFISYQKEQSEDIESWLKTTEQIQEFSLFQRTIAKFDSDTLNVLAIESEQQQNSMLLKQGRIEPLNQTGDGCYINEQLALRHSIELQEMVRVSQGKDSLTCRVAGVYYDYGTQSLGIRIPLHLTLDKLSGWHKSGYGLFFKPGMAMDKQRVISELDLDEDRVFEPQQVKRLALDIFSQTFVLTQAIAFVLLSIACFGLFLSVNSLELARKPDLHILSSLGYSRLALFGHMLAQWFLLIFGVIALSWPVAIVLANALVSQILPASFGWSMPLVLDVGAFTVSSLIGLLILIPALGIPLYKLNVRASLS